MEKKIRGRKATGRGQTPADSAIQGTGDPFTQMKVPSYRINRLGSRRAANGSFGSTYPHCIHIPIRYSAYRLVRVKYEAEHEVASTRCPLKILSCCCDLGYRRPLLGMSCMLSSSTRNALLRSLSASYCPCRSSNSSYISSVEMEEVHTNPAQ